VVKGETTELLFDSPGDYLVPQKMERSPSVIAGDEEDEEEEEVEDEAQRAQQEQGAVAAIAAAVGAARIGGEAVAVGGDEEARSAARELTAAVFASVAGR